MFCFVYNKFTINSTCLYLCVKNNGAWRCLSVLPYLFTYFVDNPGESWRTLEKDEGKLGVALEGRTCWHWRPGPPAGEAAGDSPGFSSVHVNLRIFWKIDKIPHVFEHFSKICVNYAHFRNFHHFWPVFCSKNTYFYYENCKNSWNLPFYFSDFW